MEGGRNKTRADYFFEKIPPIIGVILFIFPFVMSYIAPEIAAYFILLLNIYFFYKSLTYALQFAIVLLKLRQDEQVNWQQKVNGLKDTKVEMERLKAEYEFVKNVEFEKIEEEDRTKGFKSFAKYIPKFLHKTLFRIERTKTLIFLKNEIKSVEKVSGKVSFSPDLLQHVVIVPHVKEPITILRSTLEHLKAQTFPVKQINVVLAAEAADPNGVKVSELLKEEFKDVFNNIWITNHVLTEDEIVGKSANMAWAGRQAAKEVEKLGWDFKHVTITSCDADSKLPSQYLSYISYYYLTLPYGEYKFFNGAMVFYNNIWRLPFYARVKNSMSTIYNVGKLLRTDKLIPFSTYTTSLHVLREVGYWTPWITPEDYHMFFKSLMKFPVEVGVVPVYLKIMSDAAEGEGHWETIKNNYKQERRWAWGISDDGWLIQNVLKGWKRYSLRIKYLAFHTIFDHIMGPVGSFLILVGGNIPTFINPTFRNQILGVRLPGVSSFVISLTLFFMLFVIFLDFFLKPRREKESIFTFSMRLFEWAIQPLAGFFLSVVPGVEAHTRLLFGRYLEYYVTKKQGDDEIT